jgi:hypothetical protein
MKTPLFWAAALLSIGGCASSYREPPLSADHPASPVAAEAPAPARSRTLDLASAEPAGAWTGEGHGAAERTEPAPAADGGGADAAYACPMHPEVTADKPDERCPKCGMKLKKLPDPGAGR